MASVLVTAGVIAGEMAGVERPGATTVTAMAQDGTEVLAGMAAHLLGEVSPNGVAIARGIPDPGIMARGTTAHRGTTMALAGEAMDPVGTEALTLVLALMPPLARTMGLGLTLDLALMPHLARTMGLGLTLDLARTMGLDPTLDLALMPDLAPMLVLGRARTMDLALTQEPVLM
jgi:hypothetical protein